MMYCIKCGVRLADSEPRCPLCGTVVYHPELEQPRGRSPYPQGKMPKDGAGRKALSGLVIFVFLVPLVLSLFSDLYPDGKMDWFAYVAGGLGVSYVFFALPLWFCRRNPVIFLACDTVAAALYLWYIDLATAGDWFWGFALPVTAGLGLIVCTASALVRYIKRGRLYISGGIVMALGAFVLMVELLLVRTFQITFLGWSVYPLLVLSLLGGSLIYLAVNSTARETLMRKLFF